MADVQTLMLENKRTCALMMRSGLHTVLANILRSHPADVRDVRGAVLAAAPPPTETTIAAAFAFSTLFMFNRQHRKMIDEALLTRLARWLVAGDSAGEGALTVRETRTVTLQTRALRICREMCTNAALHDEMRAAGIPKVQPLSTPPSRSCVHCVRLLIKPSLLLPV